MSSNAPFLGRKAFSGVQEAVICICVVPTLLHNMHKETFYYVLYRCEKSNEENELKCWGTFDRSIWSCEDETGRKNENSEVCDVCLSFNIVDIRAA
jgi:hypothetical protein